MVPPTLRGPPGAPDSPGSGRWRWLGLVAAGCLALKLAVWLFDHGVLLHSDSGNYVRDAFTLTPAWPRPIAYGVFLRAVFGVGPDSLGAVVFAQTLLGTATALLTCTLARGFLGASRRWSLAAAGLVTLSPLALVLERFILSDALGLFALAVALAALHLFVRRPAWWTALALGLAAVLPQLVRAAWVFLPPLLAILALVGVVSRGTAGRWRAAALIAAAFAVSTLAIAAYSAQFSARNAGGASLTSGGGSGYSGWVLWGSVARFAEPDDLRGFPGGDILLSDPESLQRNGSWQIWDFRSTANRLREERYDGSFARANRPLLEAALRVAIRHPVAFAGQLARSLWRFFRPIQGNNDYSRVVNLHPGSVAHIEEALGAGAAPDPPRPPRIGAALRAWRWLRWLWSSLPLVALAAGLWRPRRRYPLLVVGALGTAYLLVVNIAVGFVFIERYYLPVEYLAILALTALAATWARTRATPRTSGTTHTAEASAP